MRSATRKRTGRDPAYLAWIRTQWCWVCEFVTGSEHGSRIVEAAHVGSRGLSQKCPDRETMPLCIRHHRTGPESHHRMQKKFWTHHGLNREEIIQTLNHRYDEERAA